MTWRYIAQRALTNEILELELPLDRDELTWDLSGPGTLRGTLTPDIGQLRAADGRLLLEEWGTLLYAEADGEIRWGGIVVSSKFAGEKWSVEAAGFTTYPTGIPFTASYSGVKVDPAAVVRMLWAHVQSFPDANLGVTVVGETPVRLGSDSEVYLANAVAAVKEETARVASEEAKLDAARKQLTDARKAQTDATKARTAARKVVTERKSALTAAKKTKDPAKISAAQSALDAANRAFAAADARVTSTKATVTTRSAAVTAQTAVVKDRKGDLKDAKDAETENKEKVSADGGAYKLRWWEAPDAGAEIDKLARETPFDYVERHSWSGEGIRHEVQLAYPRLGRRREDLAFVQGDNIVSLVEPDLDGADFANEVLGLGAGEGAGALRRTTAVRDGRLRRVAVHSAKDVASASRLDAQIRDALIQHRLGLEIDSVSVRDHPNAPIGSWSLGDDVLIEASLPWLGDIAVWHRITGWTLTSDHTATLQLARSDSFIYGG